MKRLKKLTWHKDFIIIDAYQQVNEYTYLEAYDGLYQIFGSDRIGPIVRQIEQSIRP